MLKSIDMLTISLAVVALTFAGARPAAALSVGGRKEVRRFDG
jgi:hypothetical protein